MVADGGIPPRRYAADASVAEATAMIRAYAAQQAGVNEDMARRLATVERANAEQAERIAALEDRRARTLYMAQGVIGFIQTIARPHH
jgi:hypothetical protein